MPGAAERVKALFIVDQEWKAFGFGPVTCLCHSFPQENAPLCSNQSDEAGHLSSWASIQISNIRKKETVFLFVLKPLVMVTMRWRYVRNWPKEPFKNIKNWHTRCARWCNDSNLDNNIDTLDNNLDDNLEDNLDDQLWQSTVDNLDNVSNFCQI